MTELHPTPTPEAAQALAEAGADLILVGRDADALEVARAELAALGRWVAAVAGDVNGSIRRLYTVGTAIVGAVMLALVFLSLSASRAVTNPILALTAETLERTLRAFDDAGANGYLSKPFDPQRLIRAVAGLLPDASRAA
jgi:CheY-like chemotaxis protein